MKLQAKLKDSIDITEYYSVNIKSLWSGFIRENAAFKWLCVYFFFEYIRPQDLYPVLDILPWGQLSLVLCCVLAISDPKVKWTANPGNMLFISFFFVVLLSAAFAFIPSLAFSKFDIIINWLLLYFLMITVLNNERRLILFLLVFFLLNFKMSQFGFRSFIKTGYNSYGVSGSPGWFRNAGDLGVQMCIFVPLSVAFILALREHWGKYKRFIFYLLPITGLVTIIATASRGALLGIIAAGAWFLIKSRLGIKAMAAVIAIGSIVYVILPQEMFREFEDAGEDATSVMRLAFWRYGMEVTRDHPVFGIGYYNWRDYCWYVNPDGVEGSGLCSVAHNTMVQAASETGITGFVLYILIVIYIFIANARTRKYARKIDNRFLGYIAHGLDGGLIGYLISSFFFSVLFYPMIWVQLAMTVALNQISRKHVRYAADLSKTQSQQAQTG